MTIDLITATADDFEPYIGETFQVETNEGMIALILDNIKIAKNPSLRDTHLEIDGVVYPPRHPFTLTFIGPRDQILQSLTYRVHNDNTGVLDLFLSAFKQDHDGILYESSFN